MSSPFDFFRKYQKISMALITAMAMFAFVFMDPFGTSTGQIGKSGIVFLCTGAGAVLFWILGTQKGKPYEYALAGGLMAYGPDYPSLERQHAGYVDRILRGAKPGDLPIAQPTKFDLVINVGTAKALGLAVPQSLLVRASEVHRETLWVHSGSS